MYRKLNGGEGGLCSNSNRVIGLDVCVVTYFESRIVTLKLLAIRGHQKDFLTVNSSSSFRETGLILHIKLINTHYFRTVIIIEWLAPEI
jgi:hypothetical protein